MTHDLSKAVPTAPALGLVQTMPPESILNTLVDPAEDAELSVEALLAIQSAGVAQVESIRRDDVLVRSDSLF